MTFIAYALAFLLVLTLAALVHERRCRRAAEAQETEYANGYAELERQRDLQKRRADDFFAMIDGVCAERDRIWDFYRTSAQQAGVAQQWLFRELRSALFVANRYRAKAGDPPLEVPAQLAQLVDEFGANAQAIPRKSTGELPPGGSPPAISSGA